MQLSTSLLNAILHRCLIGWIALSIFMLAGCSSDSEPEATPAVEPIATLASLPKESSAASTATPTPSPTATEVDHNAVVLASIKKQLKESHLQMIGTVMEDDNATQMQVHYAAPDRFHFVIEPSEVIAISNKIYASVDGQWMVPPDAAKAQFASFIDEFKAIPEVKNAKLIGDEEIAKEATTLYEYDAVSKLGARTIDQHSKVWIRISDGLPVLADSTAEVDGKKQHVFFAFTYDSDVNVEEPTQVMQAANQPDTPKASSSLKDWQSFSSAEGRFVALLPTKPSQQVNAINTEIGSIDLYLYLSETRTGGYMVGYADYPPEVVQQVASNDMLDGARDGMVANVKGTLLKETHVTIDGYPGREVHVSVQEGAVIMRCRLYLVGNRLYELVAGSAADQAMSEEITVFLDSFQLAQ